MINTILPKLRSQNGMKMCHLYLQLFSMLLAFAPSAHAMEKDSQLDLFKGSELITITLQETIPNNCQNRDGAIELLRSRKLTVVQNDSDSSLNSKVSKKDVGFTFPNTAPWCLLATKYITTLDFRPNLGDWACGHGYFSSHAMIAGANPFAIDLSKAGAMEANKTIWACRRYLPEGSNAKNIYRASQTSVINPGSIFMDRKNHINVAFNILHYLKPNDADQLLKNLFVNTIDGGIAILCCDTPTDGLNVINNFYAENVRKDMKYPGYGIYSKSTIVFLSDPNNNKQLVRRACKISAQDEKEKQMGITYNGIYPVKTQFDIHDNGATIMGGSDSMDSGLNKLDQTGQPYCYATAHNLFNYFEYPALKSLLEGVGFQVLNGWYTDHNIDTLYPYDHVDLDKIRKSKLVVVAQKPRG
jgi:hypothetical protein